MPTTKLRLRKSDSASFESEDLRILMKHRDEVRRWRRVAIKTAIGAVIGWLLAIAGWLR